MTFSIVVQTTMWNIVNAKEKKWFIKFIRNCLSCQNNIVKIISQVAICNPMSNTGNNYRGTLDDLVP